LLGLVVLLSLTVLDFKRSKASFEEEISYFIQDNLQNGTEYNAIDFQEVNEAFLAGLANVQVAFKDIRDSINNQLEIIDRFAEDENSVLEEAKQSFKSLSLISLVEYLYTDARLKREIKSSTIKTMLREEEDRMQKGISDLNKLLSVYNLSIFSLNFENATTQIYLHKFELNDLDKGLSLRQGVFELDKKTKEIVSFKEI